jgi:hypothetical protein
MEDDRLATCQTSRQWAAQDSKQPAILREKAPSAKEWRKNGALDDELAMLVDTWPTLPAAVRRRILRAVQVSVLASLCDDEG